MRKLLTIIATLVATMTQAQGVIDVHSHIITPEFVSALESEGRLLGEGFPLPKWDAEAQLKWMDEAGIQTSVLTLAAPQPTSAKVVRSRPMLRHLLPAPHFSQIPSASDRKGDEDRKRVFGTS